MLGTREVEIEHAITSDFDVIRQFLIDNHYYCKGFKDDLARLN